MRVGAHALSLLSVPLNVHLLLAFEQEPRSLPELRKAAGSPPPTTMRGHLRTLIELGVVERSRRNRFPGNTEFALGRAGQDLLAVLRALEVWLTEAPGGPIEAGTVAAKRSTKALVEGWSNNLVRAIAARPLTLTELDGLIASLSYPALERRLTAMRDAGLIAACPGNVRGTPYAATDWMRRAIAPLAAAARWEGSHSSGFDAPISRLDIEAAFLLAVPMLDLSPELGGTCRLAVDTRCNGEHRFAGVIVDVRGGEVVACTSRLGGAVDAVVTGSASAWMQAISGRAPGRLDLSGDLELGTEVVDGLHRALLRAPQLR